jgi:hypothetical protein
MHHNYYGHQENNHADSLPQRAPRNPNFPPFPPVAVDEAEQAGPPPRPTSPPDRVRTKPVPAAMRRLPTKNRHTSFCASDEYKS